ncbi:hypothetical protein ACF0H5_019959 [Mactra antiquata]
MNSSKRFGINEVNGLSHEEFVKCFGNVVEHCALAASAVYSSRPFKNFEDVRNRFENFVRNLNQEGKIGVILLHPDLAGKMLKTGQLTAESRREQAIGGFDSLTQEEHEKMAKWNGLYKNKFRFPFIQCVRENKKEVILRNLEIRYGNSIEVEIETNINEVIKIGALRLKDLIVDVKAGL